MTVETQIAELTRATTDLLEQVCERKQVLDDAVEQVAEGTKVATETAERIASLKTETEQTARDATDTVRAASDAVAATRDLIVGPDDESVSIPGFDDPVPTVAGRVKAVVKPYVEVATKQAIDASASAKAADDAAMRASKISGLDDVAAAVGMAALPFPDVWLPLSDSLNMLAGYGEEVKVGEHVVARKASFGRNSTATCIDKDGQRKTAAANEPRFEKEGLLIEGQSTNIIPISNFPQNLAGWVAPNSTGSLYSYVAAPDGSNNALKVSFSGEGLYQSFVTLAVGTTYTFSFYAKNDTPTPVVSNIRIGSGGNAISVTIPANTGWVRYQVTQEFTTGDTLLRWYIITKNIEVSLWGDQLEALPFASSYTPTAGAAVTRAADRLTIPRLGNECVEWYSGADPITPIVNGDTIELVPPAGKSHLRNVRGFFNPLTPAQKAAIK